MPKKLKRYFTWKRLFHNDTFDGTKVTHQSCTEVWKEEDIFEGVVRVQIRRGGMLEFAKCHADKVSPTDHLCPG